MAAPAWQRCLWIVTFATVTSLVAGCRTCWGDPPFRCRESVTGTECGVLMGWPGCNGGIWSCSDWSIPETQCQCFLPAPPCRTFCWSAAGGCATNEVCVTYSELPIGHSGDRYGCVPNPCGALPLSCNCAEAVCFAAGKTGCYPTIDGELVCY